MSTHNNSERYLRQLLVWGDEKQKRIAESTLLVAGLGGLGATVSQILARSGVASLHLVDDGTVALSDLHRQSLYGECDIGRKKVLVAEERLKAINSDVHITVDDARIDHKSYIDAGVDLVVDCLDNYSSRFGLYHAARVGQFFVHGGVQASQGQVLTLVKGESQPLDDIFAGCLQPQGPIPVTPDSVFIIAGLMCNEIFQTIIGVPKLLNRFLVIDLANFTLAFLEV